VQVDSAQPTHFTAQDLAFTEAVAHWLSVLLQRVELVERQQRAATAQAQQLVAEELVTVPAHDLGNYLPPSWARSICSHGVRRAMGTPPTCS
jgi:GAF domain-containing protein